MDLVVVRYSAEVNDYTAINLTKLDILDGFEEIKIAIAYNIVSKDGTMIEKMDTFPADLGLLETRPTESRREGLHVEYKTFKGWMTSTTGCQRWDDLPSEARAYVEYIQDFIDVPITHIG